MTFLLLALLTNQTVCFVSGDERKAVEVTCPVDGLKFQATEVRSNRWGGIDADFCPHAVKTTPLESYVWVCPGCAYTGRKADFEIKLTEAERKALLDGLKPMAEIPKGAKQDKIPGHVKFDLLAQAARIRNTAPLDIGRAYLHASWSARQQGAVYLDDFDEWEALRTSYGLNQTPMQVGFGKNRTDVDLDAARRLEKDILSKRYPSGVNRLLSRYLAAYVFRKHGENPEAERWLGEVDALKGENSVVDDAAARLRSSIALERDFQRKALAVFEPMAATSPEVAYLAGELQRRLGDRKAAVEWFKKALAANPSEAIRKLAVEQKSKAEK